MHLSTAVVSVPYDWQNPPERECLDSSRGLWDTRKCQKALCLVNTKDVAEMFHGHFGRRPPGHASWSRYKWHCGVLTLTFSLFLSPMYNCTVYFLSLFSHFVMLGVLHLQFAESPFIFFPLHETIIETRNDTATEPLYRNAVTTVFCFFLPAKSAFVITFVAAFQKIAKVCNLAYKNKSYT